MKITSVLFTVAEGLAYLAGLFGAARGEFSEGACFISIACYCRLHRYLGAKNA